MIDKLLEIFRPLMPKFTRWDGISLLIFGGLVYVAESGFRIVAGSFLNLILLLAILLFSALLLLVLEPALKRLP